MLRNALRPLALVGLLLVPSTLPAQPPPQPGLPQPRLLTITPPGGRAGSTVEVTFTGTDTDEPQGLLFSHPGLKAELIAVVVPPPDPKKPPPKPGMAGPPAAARFKVTISPGTPVGLHDVRLINHHGVSNPRVFAVGDLPEVAEKEPNNDTAEAQRIDLNSTVNGTISAGTDVDYYVFAGKKGQRVLASCLASSLDSRLHPVVEMYDATGRRLTANRNYEGTDALADVALPADGDYYVRVCEFTYTQGGPDHFYRLTVGTVPWIDAAFPPMVEPGKATQVTLYGRNLPGGQPDPTAVADGKILEKLTVTVQPPADPAAAQRLTFTGHLAPRTTGLDGFEYRLKGPAGSSNPVLFTFAHAPVVLEKEPNDGIETAQSLPVPCEVAGRIDRRSDRDYYAFQGKKGEPVAIELLGDRFGSPPDLYFQIRDAKGQPIGPENDDDPDILHPQQFYTRTSDPATLRFVPPADGRYFVVVSSREAPTQFGVRHVYRLRVSPEQPDFRLVDMPPSTFAPSSHIAHAGGLQYMDLFVWRRDGFNAPIALTAENLPTGVTCPPQTIAPGLNQAALVLSAAPSAAPAAVPIVVKGTATVHGRTLVREARSATITWQPLQPQQNIPAVCRMDRALVLAVVRESAPFRMMAAIDKAVLKQGEKATVTLTVARLLPDFKAPITVTPFGQVPGRRQQQVGLNVAPVTLNPGKDTATTSLTVPPNLPPGTYSLVVRGQAPVTPVADPKNKRRQPAVVVLPSLPVTVTVLPLALAKLTATSPNANIKAGGQGEVVVRVERLFEYDGPFTVKLLPPAGVKGVTAADVTVAAGQSEAKLVVQVPAGTKPGNLGSFVVQATAVFEKALIVQETKINLNAVK